jgi:hypothetical protein
MRRSLFEEPSASTASPMLSLLPSLGTVTELEKFSASFFARLEKVETLRAAADAEDNSELRQRLVREAEMLQEVLAWTSGRPVEG